MKRTDVVAITDFHGRDLSLERQLVSAAGFRLEELPTEEALRARADEIDALAVRHFHVSESLLRALTRCRIVVRYGVGYENIPVSAATKMGMIAARVPDYCTEEVAEQALTGALLHIRRTLAYSRDVAAGTWNAQIHIPVRSDSVRLVIVGLGRIGSALARKGLGVGFKVSAFDPFIPESAFRECGVQELSTLDEALAQADILSLHVPLTRPPDAQPTLRMIGAAQLEKMKPGAVLINTARGPVIDNAALCQALESGRLGGAFLDVLEDEPKQGSLFQQGDLPALDKLRKMENVLLTPHCSFNSEQSVARVKELGTQEIIRVLQGEWPRSIAWANPEVRDVYAACFKSP
jgi:D-3-phosphoglycerate dehydrogenase / 2-oxoglutarate reductase